MEIIEYENKYQADFKRLNLEWLDKYDLTESHDLEILNNPMGTVIDKGGHIFLALEAGRVVGTAGLWKKNAKEYELVKMSVDPAYRGRGISKLLLDRCLDEAKKINAEKISLFSNSKLLTALRLYEKYGFHHVAVTDSPMATADVKMELSLSPNQ
ncbi:MAG TPA: GNAT family N-acetyltransferase [Ferruginibacter sp.]|nr:GNAT family N-acetyltransferase [Ferruginibacter sp.]